MRKNGLFSVMLFSSLSVQPSKKIIKDKYRVGKRREEKRREKEKRREERKREERREEKRKEEKRGKVVVNYIY